MVALTDKTSPAIHARSPARPQLVWPEESAPSRSIGGRPAPGPDGVRGRHLGVLDGVNFAQIP
jgi:hypothetical protein